MKKEKSLVLFGAGMIGRRVLHMLRDTGEHVAYFLDNDEKKYGSYIDNVPVIGLKSFLTKKDSFQVFITCGVRYQDQIIKQLQEVGVTDFSLFDMAKLWKFSNRETIVSFSHIKDMEDVILYHVFHEEKNLFYIDVGANDPWLSSVTRLLYEHGPSGIDIEPIPEMAALYPEARPRDVILNVGVGAAHTQMTLYLQGANSGEGSTIIRNHVESTYVRTMPIEVYTLKEICDNYFKKREMRDIHILKIDVEGAEREVLSGADFSTYRPWCVVIESTLPNTSDPCYEKWERILIEQGYHFIFSHGVNRYYVAEEHSELDNSFLPMDELMKKYRVFHAELVN